jgi:cellulose synthase (UDP-forming)
MNPILSVLSEGLAPGIAAVSALLLVLPWVDRESPWRAVPIAIVIALTLRYLAWRAMVTIPSADAPVDFIAGWLLFVIECAAAAGAILSYVTLMRVKDRTPEADANQAWLRTLPKSPLVDVFICTYNEEREILERTMLGAMHLSYPNFRVWVLDDGRRPWLAELARELGCRYLTRPDNAHAKAGNINHALRHVCGLQTPPDFVSILDADFVPTSSFLTRTLALFRQADVGIVQTPQHFINPDPIQANLHASDAWPDEQRYFFEVLMPAKDAWGTAFCCGTSSVIRMSALAKAGGFPTESVTEDYLLTLRLKRHGYRTVYLNERLSLGLAPEGIKEYITQRSRWCLGFMQIVRSADGPFNPGNGLALRDRVSLIETLLYWSAAYLFRVAGLLIPILYLLFGIQAVNVGTADGIAHFVPYYLASVAVMAWLSGQRVLPIMTDLSQLLAAREILTAVVVGLLRPKGRKFKVTAKGGDRSGIVIQWRMLLTFAAMLMMTALGIVVAFDGSGPLQDSSVVALYWGWYNMTILIAAIAVCIERPRLRRNERLRGSQAVVVTVGERSQAYQTADISLDGMRLIGRIDAPLGADVLIEIGQSRLDGRIVRRTEREFAVEIKPDTAARAAMVRQVYSGGFESAVSRIRSGKVAGKVLARIFH